MRFDVTISEAVELIKKIQEESGNFFEMIRVNIRETFGHYFSGLMEAELTDSWAEGDRNVRKRRAIIATDSILTALS